MKWIVRCLSILLVLAISISTTAHAKINTSSLHWGFKKSSNGQPVDAGEKLEGLLDRYGAVYKGDPQKKVLYLTFDNGYENGYTEKILNVLKKEKAPATFFVTGHYLNSAPDLVKRMVKEGHIIGNHSWHHPDLSKVSQERFIEELEKVRVKTKTLTGQKNMTYLRPPRGTFSERTLALAKKQGYTHVFWSIAFIDWYTNDQKGWRYSYNNIMRQVHPGGIILLHTVSKDNADALEKVIKDLKKQGYTFKSLDDLMLDNAMESPMLY